MNDFFRRYLLPGFVFESAVIAGGYATGRELVEFFLPAGPWGGLLGMVVGMLVWSAVLMVSFELARVARCTQWSRVGRLATFACGSLPVEGFSQSSQRNRGRGRGSEC